MKKNSVEIVLILDRSGSMEGLRESAISGLNDFIKEQQETLKDKTVKFSLVLFNHEYAKTIDRININDFKPLTQKDYEPDGMTALLDAIGRTTKELGEVLALTPEDERPENVIIAIMTDGGENNSKHYNNAKIKEMIQHQESLYNWTYTYLSSDLKAVHDAVSAYGIQQNMTLCFSASSDGYNLGHTGSSYRGLAKCISSVVDKTDSGIKINTDTRSQTT